MPIYGFYCQCGNKKEVLLPIDGEAPLCCNAPMQRGCGSLAFYRMKGDIQGSTPGIRKYAQEITDKKGKR